MSEPENKRTRHTTEERIAVIDSKIEVVHQTIAELEEKKQASAALFDKKIEAAQEKIKTLEAKKRDILAPKPPRKTKKQKIQEILKEAQKSGMKPEEIADRLGITLTK